MSLLARVARHMECIAPLRLAESWDNVGTLVEALVPPPNNMGAATAANVMLTIDLTDAVLAEALQRGTGVIVAYHPPLFGAVKRLTGADPMQARLLRCIAAGISVYSPHTALDSVPDGINDWLCKCLGEGSSMPIVAAGGECLPGSGAGRLHTLRDPVPAETLLGRVKAHLGLDVVRVAWPQMRQPASRVAVCAGSGSSVLAKLNACPGDVWLTGEMSHHEILAAVSRGVTVILTEHSNSERGFLAAELQPRLQRLFDGDGDKHLPSVHVWCSPADRDPIAFA